MSRILSVLTYTVERSILLHLVLEQCPFSASNRGIFEEKIDIFVTQDGVYTPLRTATACDLGWSGAQQFLLKLLLRVTPRRAIPVRVHFKSYFWLSNTLQNKRSALVLYVYFLFQKLELLVSFSVYLLTFYLVQIQPGSHTSSSSFSPSCVSIKMGLVIFALACFSFALSLYYHYHLFFFTCINSVY